MAYTVHGSKVTKISKKKPRKKILQQEVDEVTDSSAEYFYELSPEERARRFVERLPVVGQPFPYNPDVHHLPADMMFMHESIYPSEAQIENVDVWEQMKIKVVPELDKVWEIVEGLQGRVQELEDELARIRGVAPATGTEGVVDVAG